MPRSTQATARATKKAAGARIRRTCRPVGLRAAASDTVAESMADTVERPAEAPGGQASNALCAFANWSSRTYTTYPKAPWPSLTPVEA